MVLLIGNYAADRQHSMQRFGAMMLEGLRAARVEAELVQPEARFGRLRMGGAFLGKWLAYVDKFILFPRRLRALLRARRPALVHICDHSNAMYAKEAGDLPVVVTCHDLLAVRGGLGEETDTPASTTGRFLQRWILRSLAEADAIACISQATRADAERLLPGDGKRPRLEVIPLGLSYPFRPLARGEMERRLAAISGGRLDAPFVLHVGSNLRRKNREAILRIFARARDVWTGQLVFAGEKLSETLRAQADALGIFDRIVEVPQATNETLETLYNGAGVLLFPSRFEGFGWPIIEAQACGCPILSSAREPMAEIVGGSGLLREPADEEGFAHDLRRLADASEREQWSRRSLENAQRFTTARMIERYRELYRSLVPSC